MAVSQNAQNVWIVRLRFGSGRRERFALPHCHDETSAKRREKRLGALAKALHGVPEAEARLILRKASDAPTEAALRGIEKVAYDLAESSGKPAPGVAKPVTFRELAEQWTDGDLAKRYPDHIKVKRSVSDDVSRLGRLYPTIGDVPIRDFTLDHAERAMAKLPETAKRPTSRRHYAQLIRRVLQLAVYPCRIIEHSPLPRGFLPSDDHEWDKNFLYPADDAKLLSCPEVPLLRRALYGFLMREGMRLSEALGLRWRDLNLSLGTVTLTRTKTGKGRTWELSPGVAEALTALRGDAPPEANVFPFESTRRDAELFREHLKAAGIDADRPELFETTETRLRIRIHDTRTTFVTLSLAAGKSERWVMRRTGHRSSQQVSAYEAQAEMAKSLGFTSLEPLNTALGLGHKVGQGQAGGVSGGGDSSTISTKCAREDSNFHALRRRNLKTTGADADLCKPVQTSGETPIPKTDLGAVECAGPTEQAQVGQTDPVELALAEALTAASRAQQWDVVAALAAELAARRTGAS